MRVPVSTPEKPLTALDFIGAIDGCTTIYEVSRFCAGCPQSIRQDARFAIAAVSKLTSLASKLRVAA